MPDKYFIDTNIIIYAFDQSDARRQKISQALIKIQAIVPTISTQVLQETFVNLEKKVKLPFGDILIWMKNLTKLEICQITPELIFDGISITRETSISFWDSLIVSAAAKSNCKTIYTEDLNHGQVIRGVQIINPYLSQGVQS